MVDATDKRSLLKVAALVAVAAGAGVVNGILGTGAGTVLYFLFRKTAGNRGGSSPKDCFCAAMAAVFPISLISAATYPESVTGGDGLLLPLIIPAALGGLLGAAISEKADSDVLKKTFAVIVSAGGAYMLFG